MIGSTHSTRIVGIRRHLPGVAGVVLLVIAALSPRAMTFTVTPDIATPDEHDATPGDGVAISENGHVSFRAAIEEANALPGPDTIILQSSLFIPFDQSSVWLTQGNLEIEDDLSILGRAAIDTNNDINFIDWFSEESTIVVKSGVELYIEEVEISLRRLDNPSVAFRLEADAILQASPHRERDSAVGMIIRAGNAAIISIGGDVILDKSSVGTEAEISALPAIQIEDAQLELKRTFVFGFQSLEDGGAISAINCEITLNSCSLSSSKSPSGAGIYAIASNLVVSNSTFSGLESEFAGGAIYLDDSSLLMLNCTVARNTANTSEQKGVTEGGGGVYATGDTTIQIGNTLIAENVDYAGLAPDIQAQVLSLGNNLIGVADGAQGFIDEDDQTGNSVTPLDPKLGQSDINQIWIPLLEGSTAIDGGDTASLVDGTYIETVPLMDIRQLRQLLPLECYRFRGTSVDIGSYEFDPSPDTHTADQDGDLIISLTEMLRVIQFFNSDGYSCAESFDATEDGYIPGQDGTLFCAPSDLEFDVFDWDVNLTELLRVIQLYNSNGYTYCPFDDTEDDFCPA